MATQAPPPAIAVLEVASIVRGLTVVDAMVKRAEVQLLRADPVTPGKYVIVICGQVGDVEEALQAGEVAAGGTELDVLFLPDAHPAIVPALTSVSTPPVDGSLGALEFSTVAATLLAAERALKTCDVTLAAMHWARGVGGKGYLVFTGEQHEVEAALDAGYEAVEPRLRIGRELIANPHPDVDWALARLNTGKR